MKNELLKRARIKKRTGKRPTVGCFMPTDRELQRELRDAPWSREVQKGDKHHLARYRYEEKLQDVGKVMTDDYQ